MPCRMRNSGQLRDEALLRVDALHDSRSDVFGELLHDQVFVEQALDVGRTLDRQLVRRQHEQQTDGQEEACLLHF